RMMTLFFFAPPRINARAADRQGALAMIPLDFLQRVFRLTGADRGGGGRVIPVRIQDVSQSERIGGQ
ncbi:MAG: hypothetical protein M1565_01235, partial [Actinobacteria bacterium]|nr:hypothetical protein [Actinomycetota bacterium]